MIRDKNKLPISIQENKKVKLLVCDIRESNKYNKEISQINYLIHTATAWGDPKRAYEVNIKAFEELLEMLDNCLLYTSPSPRDLSTSRMPSSA